MSPAAMERYRVGYALEAEKAKRFIVASLVEQAEEKGLDLVPIDPAKPLSEQGPFHCIIHKLYGPEWARQLLLFPGPVVDPPPKIDLLHNRTTMLDAVSRLQIPFHGVSAPRQVIIHPDSDSVSVSILGIKFPAIAKPLMANGATGSHDMALLLSHEAVHRLHGGPAMILQEFINHGGVLFKVYVAGRHVSCVRRASLPDVTVAGDDSVLPFSRISDADSGADDDGLPEGLAEELAAALGKELGLRLFNFDVIKSSGGDEKYYVVDINYFPGYDKMPDFERVFTDFLFDVVRENPNNN